MTSDEYLQVRGPTPFDGSRWHVVTEVDGHLVTTDCGETYDVKDLEVEISPVGERPNGLSGNTVCYGCEARDAAEEAVDDDGAEVVA